MSKPVVTISLSAGIADTSTAKAVRQLEGNARDHEATIQTTTAAVSKVTAGTVVSGSKAGNAALASLITALQAAGIITDQST